MEDDGILDKLKILSDQPVVLNRINIPENRKYMKDLYQVAYNTATYMRKRNYIKWFFYYGILPPTVETIIHIIRKR